MKKRAVLVVMIALSLIGIFSFDYVNAENFITPMISSMSPELGSMINSFAGNLSLIKNTDSNLNYMITSSRGSADNLDYQITLLYDDNPDNKQLMMMKSNLNQINSILDATEKIQKTYAAINHIESNIFEMENTVQEVNVSEDTIESIDESIEELDTQIDVMIQEDPENEELVNIQSNLEELDELISDSKTVHISIEDSNKKSKNLSELLNDISSGEITESDIEELELAIAELDESVPEVDETTPEQIDAILKAINLDLDTLLQNDPNNIYLIDMKADVYQISMLTSNYDDLYSAPSELDASTINIEELLTQMYG